MIKVRPFWHSIELSFIAVYQRRLEGSRDPGKKWADGVLFATILNLMTKQWYFIRSKAKTAPLFMEYNKKVAKHPSELFPCYAFVEHAFNQFEGAADFIRKLQCLYHMRKCLATGKYDWVNVQCVTRWHLNKMRPRNGIPFIWSSNTSLNHHFIYVI